MIEKRGAAHTFVGRDTHCGRNRLEFQGAAPDQAFSRVGQQPPRWALIEPFVLGDNSP
jgi:hypothetical protein